MWVCARQVVCKFISVEEVASRVKAELFRTFEDPNQVRGRVTRIGIISDRFEGQ
jgi:hypothetical protein